MREPVNAPENVALMRNALRMSAGFKAWPDATMNRLLAHSQLGRYARGDVVSSEREHTEVFAVVSGHLITVRTEKGGPGTVLGLMGPGRVVGLARMVYQEDVEFYDYTAFGDAVVIHIPWAVMTDILAQEPILWRDLGILSLRQQRESLASLLQRRIGSLQRRLAAALERLAALYGVEEGGELRIRLKLTQEDLASMLQVARQSVNKELKLLAERQLIALDYNTITVLDAAALRTIAAQD